MRKKKSPNKGNNTKLAIVFLAFVISILVISFLFKFIFIIGQSQFDDSRRFTITVSNPENLEVISFSPIGRSISILKLDKNIDSPVNQFLAIPIDGFVKGNSVDINQEMDSLFFGMVLNYKKLQTNLTIVDCIRLFIFSRSLPDRRVYIRNISQDLTMTDIDSIVKRLVNDELIEKDGQTIQIVNATNVYGLGNRLARLIGNMGGDVIIVATANNLESTSTISYVDNKNYTVERLSKILDFKTIKTSDKKISDITIVVGKDSLNSLAF